VLVTQGYKFRFWASDRGEPPHAHVMRGEKMAKIWIQSGTVEYNHGYDSPELNRIVKRTRQNQAKLLGVWNEYFSG
jgi:hypothetical protein